MKSLLITLTLAFASFQSAAAQSFNIDVDDPAMSGGPTPGTYGGVPAQTGFWNVMPAPGVPVTLTDLTGALSTVTAAVTTAPHTHMVSTHGSFVGAPNESLLMSDYLVVDQTKVWTISGLEEGTYEVYTYAWHPNRSFLTTVTVNGNPTMTGGEGGKDCLPVVQKHRARVAEVLVGFVNVLGDDGVK